MKQKRREGKVSMERRKEGAEGLGEQTDGWSLMGRRESRGRRD